MQKNVLFYTKLKALCDNVYRYQKMGKSVRISEQKDIHNNDPMTVDEYVLTALQEKSDALKYNQRFKQSDAKLSSLGPFRKTSIH